MFCLFFLPLSQVVKAQELEPRSLTNVPVGTSFFGLNYSFSNGNVLFDPSLPLEDVNAGVHAIIGGYVRSFNFFGMQAKYNLILPFVTGNWTGALQNVDSAISRTGFADIRLGFSFNFIGSPALELSEFKTFKQSTIAGFSLHVVLPTGQYYDDRLINLGTNRVSIRPQFGVSQRLGSWYLELLANTWVFTTNSSFWDGNTLQQEPIGTVKLHLIKAFNKGAWVSVGMGYAIGGQNFINDIGKEARISTMRFGVIGAVPIGRHNSIKIIALSAVRFEQGADFDAFSIAYQYRWNKES
jgi:hypothetical protein